MATSLNEQAETHIQQLEELIDVAQRKKINTLKEQTSIRTAEIFLNYAQWDENNIDTNTQYFSRVAAFKKEAEKYALNLPNWERQEIVTMLKEAIAELELVLKGKKKRLNTPQIDWTKAKVQGDCILFNEQAVFLSDWTWKPDIDAYKEFHGQEDGFYITPNYVSNAQGDIAPHVIKTLKAKEDGALGFIFINHSSIPAWAKAQDPSIADGSCPKNYTAYDISNPLARDIQSKLLAQTIPLMAGKKYTQLGYMLCNEPHWNCIQGEWASAPLSEKGYEGFLAYLEKKHERISRLNTLWGSDYKSFKDIDAPRIMKSSAQGSPLYFDFMRYNMQRATDWFAFLAREVKKYDPKAKTHIKVMPSLWSGGKRDHGLDMEALTRNSEIIGNDAGTCGATMWGAPKKWQKNYSYNWRELCMSYDFFKSISPDKIVFNTEGHMLSTVHTRDLTQSPEYVRNTYWLAHIHGLTAIQSWYWSRREDGSSRSTVESADYAGSNNHQPRVVNEVHCCTLDLNSVSNEIMAFQRQRKGIRLFYTEASAINLPKYMDGLYNFYESLFFEGRPLGFATANIITENNNKDWDLIAVTQCPHMFESDLIALQKYLDQGGTVLIDKESMQHNEYGGELQHKLRPSKGKLIRLASSTEIKEKALSLSKGPSIEVVDDNGLSQKGCVWRLLEGKRYILNLVNLSKNPTTITLKDKKSGTEIKAIRNVLTGENISNGFTLPLYGVLLLEIKLP